MTTATLFVSTGAVFVVAVPSTISEPSIYISTTLSCTQQHSSWPLVSLPSMPMACSQALHQDHRDQHSAQLVAASSCLSRLLTRLATFKERCKCSEQTSMPQNVTYGNAKDTSSPTTRTSSLSPLDRLCPSSLTFVHLIRVLRMYPLLTLQPILSLAPH